MCDVGHVTLEAFVAHLTEEDFTLLVLLVFFNPPHVLLDIQILLTPHQQAPLQPALTLHNHRFLLLLALRPLLNSVFLAAPLVSLSGDGTLKPRLLAHLL